MALLSPARFKQFALITGGSAFFMALKAAATELLIRTTHWPAWANYAVVTVSITLLGWLYHSRVSFRQPLTRQNLRRYLEQAVGLKILDYVLVNALIYLFGLRPLHAIITTSVFVFVSRVVLYMKYVFKPEAAPADASLTPGING